MKKEKEPYGRIKKTNIEKIKMVLRENRQLHKQKNELELNLSELREKYLGLAAEFDNYRKRSEKEKRDLLKFGTESLLLQLIPFDDIFESILKQVEHASSLKIIHQGLEMLKKEFSKFLGVSGVNKIETIGEKFNPEFHEAAAIIETEDYEDGTVAEEERTGYLFHGRVIRPAVVKVAKNPAKGDSDEDFDTREG